MTTDGEDAVLKIVETTFAAQRAVREAHRERDGKAAKAREARLARKLGKSMKQAQQAAAPRFR